VTENDLRISKTLFSRLAEAEHIPGKVRFTKYLYLLDYFYWHFHGRQLTNVPWKFFHFGPWAEEAEECMQTISGDFQVRWHDFEFEQMYTTPRLPSLGFEIEGLIKKILEFRYLDDRGVLHLVYSETEPMAAAQRGDRLDFGLVPVDQRIPRFGPVKQAPKAYQLPQRLVAKMEDYRHERERRRTFRKQRSEARQTPEYIEAMRLLAEELTGNADVANKTASFTDQAVESFGLEE